MILSETASGADLGGRSKYSNENFEGCEQQVALWHRKQVGGLATLTSCLEVAKRSASGEWGPVVGMEDHYPFLPENFRRHMVAEDRTWVSRS